MSSRCVDSMAACCGLLVLVWDVKSPTCPSWSITHTPHDGWMKPLVVPEAWARTTRFIAENTKDQSPNVNAKLWEVVRNAGQRISLHFPFFMYLWHVIKPGCLDREITPCLPTNKPPALVSSPLFIIHNLLWCQGQSDCIVMVKGKSGEPELSTRTENPGRRQTKTWSLTAWILINSLKRCEELEKVTESDQRLAYPDIKTQNKTRTRTIEWALHFLEKLQHYTY